MKFIYLLSPVVFLVAGLIFIFMALQNKNRKQKRQLLIGGVILLLGSALSLYLEF